MQGPESAEQLPPKRPRQAGTLASLRLTLWHAVKHAEFVMTTTNDTTTRLRAVHAITQASMAYCKLQETLDLETRLAALEAIMEERRHDQAR
jgi:hypothetical protein